MPDEPRRRFLHLCASAATASMAACVGTDDADSPTPDATATRTETETPTSTPPSTTPTETETPPDDAATEAWTVDDLSGRVDRLLLPAAGPADESTGPLYAATEAGEVARLTTEGGLLWSTTVSGAEDGDPVITPTDGAVYAISETFTDERLATHVEALDRSDGSVRWTFEDRVFLRVVGAVDDLVVLAGEYIAENPEAVGPNRSPRGDGRIYGVDRATGAERWSVDVPRLDGAAVASHGVYALETREYETHVQSLHAFAHDGTERWSVDTGTVRPNAPVVTDDLLLASAGTDGTEGSGGVGRYDPADGSLLWTAGDWEHGPAQVTVRDGTINAGAGPFLSLGPDGTERYRVQMRGDIDTPATPTTIYTDGGTQLVATDRNAGKVRWRYEPERFKYTHLRAVLADYAAVDRGIGEDREAVLLDEANGDVVGTFRTPDPYWGMVGAGRRLFIGVGTDVVAYDVAADLD